MSYSVNRKGTKLSFDMKTNKSKYLKILNLIKNKGIKLIINTINTKKRFKHRAYCDITNNIIVLVIHKQNRNFGAEVSSLIHELGHYELRNNKSHTEYDAWVVGINLVNQNLIPTNITLYMIKCLKSYGTRNKIYQL